MKRMLLILCLTAFCVGIGTVAFAGPHDNARFALHVKNNFVPTKTITTLCAYSPTNPAAEGGTALPCTDYVVTRGTNEFPGPNVFLIIGQAGGVGVIGASFGIEYSGSGGVGIDPAFINWTGCADGLEFPNDGGAGDFPAPGGGMRVTWSNCQNTDVGGIGVHTTVGAFYVYAYSEDVMSVTPNNNLTSGPELALSACGGGTTDLLQVFPPEIVGMTTASVHFGGDGSQGYNPCGVVPAFPTTWGKIKAKYQEAGE